MNHPRAALNLPEKHTMIRAAFSAILSMDNSDISGMGPAPDNGPGVRG